jgi:hypothetical protein
VHWIGSVGFGFFNLLRNQFFVLFETLGDNLLFADEWQEICPGCEERLNNHLDVPDLVLEGVANRSVITICHDVAHLLLDVALLVVLFHLGSHPLEIHDAILARIAVVRCVNTHVQQHLLVLIDVLRELFGAESSFECH